MAKWDFLLAGVGGQGTILAGDILSSVGLRAGYEVKKSEVHGMAQRGGSVTTSVRWADEVHSPLIAPGEADVLLAFEKLEALRYVDMVHPDAIVLVNDYAIPPLSVSSGQDKYPNDEVLQNAFASLTEHYYLLPASSMAEELGQARVNNVVMLGALSYWMPDIPASAWLQAVRQRVPVRLAELNEQAFLRGFDYITAHHRAS